MRNKAPFEEGSEHRSITENSLRRREKGVEFDEGRKGIDLIAEKIEKIRCSKRNQVSG